MGVTPMVGGGLWHVSNNLLIPRVAWDNHPITSPKTISLSHADSARITKTQALVFLIRRVWVRVPFLTLVSLRKTLIHYCCMRPCDRTLTRWSRLLCYAR